MCGRLFNECLTSCPECGTESFGTSLENTKNENKSAVTNATDGAWLLTQVSPRTTNIGLPLYTGICADVIKNKITGQKYKRGKFELFRANKGETMPELVEQSNDYDFIFYDDPLGLLRK